MPNPPPLADSLLWPVARVGRETLHVLSYLGGLATLTASAARAVVWPAGAAPPFGRALSRQVASLLAMGLPLVGLVHVGIGSFLSMQAYFGGTFVDGTGAVVGVGLLRNVAPLMAGMTLAGLVAAKTTAELRGRSRAGLDQEPGWAADRAGSRGGPPVPVVEPDPARLAAVRLAASLVVGPVLAVWGTLVGTVVGWQVAQSLLGVSTHSFFSMFEEMIWTRDVTGLALKAMAFGFFSALFACHEGLRGPSRPDPQSVPSAACRAACLALVAILIINSGWFLLLYHAGPAFGPTLLEPPG